MAPPPPCAAHPEHFWFLPTGAGLQGQSRHSLVSWPRGKGPVESTCRLRQWAAGWWLSQVRLWHELYLIARGIDVSIFRDTVNPSGRRFPLAPFGT